jgi:release factor glutamine methyltransferase
MNAELLLMFTLSCDRAYLYAHPERELTGDEQSRYEAYFAERARGVPAQYITGHQEFWGMDLIVTPVVLIPRPETEHVIETVLDLIRQAPTPTGRLRIADIGTGSGCIALALAKELSHAEIVATTFPRPRSKSPAPTPPAINSMIASNSAKPTCSLDSRTAPFDFIVSNPPYVGESEEDQVQLEVRKFEPRNAVFAGPTGLEVIAR